MSVTAIIVIVAAIALIAVIASRGNGPRVTHIDRTVRTEKDRDDA